MAQQTVTLQPGESKLISFEATPQEAKTYQVSVNGLSGSFTASKPPFYWLRPTGHVGYEWNDPELAYDGWTDTRAEIVGVNTQSWSAPLELIAPNTEISAIRYWASSPIHPVTVDVDIIMPDNTVVDLYEGSATKQWDDGIPLPGGPQFIKGATIRFFNFSRSVEMKFRVNEFQFYGYAEAPPVPPEPPPGTTLSGHVADSVTGEPIVGVTGTVYQDKGTDTWSYDFTTNSQGYYLIDNMLPDADLTQMVIYADGYETYTNENVRISEGDNQINVWMTPV